MSRSAARNPYDLRKGASFAGALSRGDLRLALWFRVWLGSDGELRVRVRDVRVSRDTVAMRRLWRAEEEHDAVFVLEGVSRAGMSFRCEDAIIVGSGSKSNRTGNYVTLTLECSQVVFRRPFDEPQKAPVVRQALRDFECSGDLRASTPLGEVVMVGTRKQKRPHLLTGVLQVIAPERPADPKAWRAEVERLFEHIRYVMGFAAAHPVKAPLQDFIVDDALEMTATSQSRSRKNHHPVFDVMSLQPIFSAAVASYFDPPVAARNLHFALEWFAMSATYTETRLLQAMTALENLVESNLPAGEKRLLPPKMFERVANDMRAAARTRLAEGQSPPDEAISRILEALAGKLQDLNRRPLFGKLMRLADLWGVSLAGLPREDIAAAIKARNRIVHRGYYYEPGEAPPTQRALWDHVLLMREVIARFVFKAVGFEGRYLSFRGGQHHLVFPPAEFGSSPTLIS